jgi:predicted SprT family Zn-dependent metalloprotease
MELRAAYDLAVALVGEHGLRGWRVELDSAKRRAGVCRFGARVIGVSAPLARVHSEAEVRDTILHEIAHALVGPEHGHDRVWRETARRIGSSGRRCVDSENGVLPGAWTGICPSGHVSTRHRRPERVMSCPDCRPTFSAHHLLEWTYRGRPATMHPNYLAELESLTTGRAIRRVGVGGWVRVTLPGEYFGVEGRVVKLGRTSYHLEVPGRARRGYLLRVVFAGAEPA